MVPVLLWTVWGTAELHGVVFTQYTAEQIGGGIANWMMGSFVSNPILVAQILVFSAPFYLFQWLFITLRGQTVGKWIVRIKVVDADGRPPGFLRGVIAREWTVA